MPTAMVQLHPPRTVWAVAAAVFLSVCAVAGPQQLDISRETAPADNLFGDSTQYSAVAEGNRIVLGYNADLQRLRLSVVRASDGTMAGEVAAATKMTWLQQLLKRFFADQAPLDRYSFAINGYTEMSSRIADAAFASKDWNLRTGSDRRGEDFVLNLLKRSPAVYRELVGTFRAFGYHVAVESLENRLVLRYAELTEHEKVLMKTKPDSDDKLPLGASVYFVVTRAR